MRDRGPLVEFLTIAGVAIVVLASLVVLSITGRDGTDTGNVVRNALTTVIGALIALAYAAQGKDKPPTDPPAPPTFPRA